MTRSEVAPTSQAEYEKDKHSRMFSGQSGPNKAGATAPDGPSILGTEIGGEQDAQRARAQAIQEGDILPEQDYQNDGTAGSLGVGQQTGYEKGMSDTPNLSQRDDMQESKNEEWSSNEPDLSSIAKNSGGSANYNPTSDPDSIVSNANKRPDQVLESAARSSGTESGTGSYSGAINTNAATENIPDQ